MGASAWNGHTTCENSPANEVPVLARPKKGSTQMKSRNLKLCLSRLIEEGEALYRDLELVTAYRDLLGEDKKLSKKSREEYSAEMKANIRNFQENYQAWYSEALSCIETLLPQRFDDFVGFYAPESKRKGLDLTSYCIRDYLLGVSTFDIGEEFILKVFFQQTALLSGAQRVFESEIFQIRRVLEADLYQDELSAAQDLNKKGFRRAAGAMAGVVLETRLKKSAQVSSINLKKKPTIGSLNDSLRNKDVFDAVVHSRIKVLADLRALCDHDKDREPSRDEVEELIAGVKRILGEDW